MPATSGTLLRIQCDYQCLLPSVPYDTRCEERKVGTGFLLQLNGVPVDDAHLLSPNPSAVRGDVVRVPTDGQRLPEKVEGLAQRFTFATMILSRRAICLYARTNRTH